MTRCQLIVLSYQVPKDSVVLSERTPILLQEFKTKVFHQYKLIGDVTVHRPTRDKNGVLVPLREITDNEFTPEENDELLVIYNEEVKTVFGGYGTGAKVNSSSGWSLAEGGFGEGGEIDADGNALGGRGLGGNAIGEDLDASAGRGYGANTAYHPGGGSAESGTGTGGYLISKTPDAVSHRAPQGEQRKQGEQGRRGEHGKRGGQGKQGKSG